MTQADTQIAAMRRIVEIAEDLVMLEKEYAAALEEQGGHEEGCFVLPVGFNELCERSAILKEKLAAAVKEYKALDMDAAA